MATKWKKGSWVCQDYIANPMLLDGLKFDLRIYVSLISLDPLKVYVCKEGLARFCTEPYKPLDPKKGTVNELAHLTNYSLNKQSKSFNHADAGAFEPETRASKRPLSTLLSQMHRAGIKSPGGKRFNEERFWDSVEECVAATCTAMLPVLRVSYARYFGQNPNAKKQARCQAFQVLGVDVMLRDDFSPILLEVNNSPSLNLTQPVNIRTFTHVVNVSKGKDTGKQPTAQGSAAFEQSPVDKWCKTIAVGGTLELLPDLRRIARGAASRTKRLEGDPRHRHAANPQSYYVQKYFFDVGGCEQDKIRDVLAQIEVMFNRSGGASKAFSAGTMRRLFAHVPGFMKKGRLTRSDIDIIAAKYRTIHANMPKEKTSEIGMRKDLAVLDWGVAFSKIVKKRHSAEGEKLVNHMSDALTRVRAKPCMTHPCMTHPVPALTRVRLPCLALPPVLAVRACNHRPAVHWAVRAKPCMTHPVPVLLPSDGGGHHAWGAEREPQEPPSCQAARPQARDGARARARARDGVHTGPWGSSPGATTWWSGGGDSGIQRRQRDRQR